MNQFEREEEDLYASCARGEVTLAELNKELERLHRDEREDVREAAEEAARRAYRDELDRW